MISCEIDRDDSHPDGAAVLLHWQVGAEHTSSARAFTQRASLTCSEAWEAADLLADTAKARATHATVTMRAPDGWVDVTAPTGLWHAVACALEIVTARVHAGQRAVGQRVDLEPDGRVTRSAAAAAGWQTQHEGA